MRITESEKLSIIDSFKSIFKDSELYLFGSRVDDSKKGGDIDLYIKLKKPLDNLELVEKEAKFITTIQNNIGDQKIDLVINNNEENSLIYKAAEETGIKLC